jgi:G:T-mismatch repair DNA endonuclease (very short patch repair protein)
MLMLWSMKERGGMELQLLGVNVLVVYMCELHKDINEWEREQSATGTRVGHRPALLVAFWLSHALILS